MKWTEATATEALRERFADWGNGGSGKYVFVPQVRTSAGFSGHRVRTMDAITLSLWPSMNFQLDAYEIKVSRSDWLVELRDLDKSAPARERCDAFWIVAPVGMVKPDELPDGWGLIELADSGRTRLKVAAARYPNRAVMPRTFVAALLRAAGAVALPTEEDS